MKRRLSLLVALLAMLCLPATMQADVVVKFKFVSGGEDITSLLNSPAVSIYQNGSVVKTASWEEYYDYVTNRYREGDGSVTLDDALVGTTLAYVSSLGHKAEFTVQADSSEIELNCSMLTVTAKDDEGNAMSGYSISLGGTTATSVRIYQNGQGVAYVVPGLYTYSWEYGSGTVDLSTDNSLSLTAKVEKIEEQKTYTVRIQPRYGNYPVGDSYYILYQDGVRVGEIYSRTNYSDYTYYWFTSVTAGTYEIRDRMDGTSGEVKIESDTTIYLDYHKVAFTSKCGSTANVGQQIGIGRLSDSYYNSDMAKLTDANGVAEFYLLSGSYKYWVAGSSTEFTVTKEDLSFNIETLMLTFKVQCDNLNAVGFRVNDVDVSAAADGTVSYGCLPGSEVQFEVMNGNSYSATTGMTVTADASKTVDVKLHALQFNSNYTGNNGIYVRTASGDYDLFTAGWNRKYYLIEGTYAYRDPATSAYVALDLTEDKTIDFNFATVTVNVVDTDGKTVTDTYVRLGSGSSERTDKSGNVVFRCVPGNYVLSWGGNSNYAEEITVEGDMQTTLTVPAFVDFSVEGLPGDDHTPSIVTPNNFYLGSIKEGVNSLRLDPTVEYHISGYHGTVKITNGCTITLGTLSVTSQGNGLAFPMENWDAVSTYNVIVGSPVRLSAIPVGNDKFQKWTVNGKDYTDAMIDFKTINRKTEATALFSGASTAVSRPMQTNSSLDFNESYITLPNEMEGSARIYTLDGKLVKQIGVVGDQIGIYDLPAGAYVLSFQHEEGVINARFVKK